MRVFFLQTLNVQQGSALMAKTQSIFTEFFFWESMICDPSIKTMNHPYLTVQDCMEKYIGLQRIK